MIKKLIAMILVVVLMMTMMVTAFANGGESSTAEIDEQAVTAFDEQFTSVADTYSDTADL